VLAVLRRRSVKLSAAAAARIRECRDLATLDAWFDRAFVVSSSKQLFAADAR